MRLKPRTYVAQVGRRRERGGYGEVEGGEVAKQAVVVVVVVVKLSHRFWF